MSCNPLVHPGYQTVCYLPDSLGALDRGTLAPSEQATIVGAKALASCMQTHPNLARLCAVPIVLSDAVCSPLVLLADTVWAIGGTVLCGLTRGISDQTTSAFAAKTLKNLSSCCAYTCFGPCVWGQTLNFFPFSSACTAENCCIACLHCPLIWPLPALKALSHVCIDPEGTGAFMHRNLESLYERQSPSLPPLTDSREDQFFQALEGIRLNPLGESSFVIVTQPRKYGAVPLVDPTSLVECKKSPFPNHS